MKGGMRAAGPLWPAFGLLYGGTPTSMDGWGHQDQGRKPRIVCEGPLGLRSLLTGKERVAVVGGSWQSQDKSRQEPP